MSTNILERVKEFLVRLVKDQAFRAQLEVDAIEEVRQVLQDAGYSFSQEEFETATIQLLDLKEQGEFHELSEEELVGLVGGFVGQESPVQPLYGVIAWPPKPNPKPNPKPCYKRCHKPHPKPIDVQPLYGVVVSKDS
jgi:predicted ribosomally synthesized peptide with nif11-like leader